MKDAFILTILIILCSTALGQENTAEYWFQKGKGFYNNASYELAVRCYDKGLEINSSNGTILNNEGKALLNLSRYDKGFRQSYQS
jgi:tetratricopeptide (TPR) repeat protein